MTTSKAHTIDALPNDHYTPEAIKTDRRSAKPANQSERSYGYLCPECNGQMYIVTTKHRGKGMERWRRCKDNNCKAIVHTIEVVYGTHKSIKQPQYEGHTPYRWKDGETAGEANPNAILFNDDVLKIRELAAKGRSYASIAKEYGMHIGTISRIVLRKSWKNI